jgi:hypothetical protein
MVSHRGLDTNAYLKSGIVPKLGEGDSVTLYSEFRRYIMEKPIDDERIGPMITNNPIIDHRKASALLDSLRHFNSKPVRLKVENEFPDLNFDFYDEANDWESSDKVWSLYEPLEIREIFECLQQSFFFYEAQLMDSILFTENTARNIKIEFDGISEFLDTTIQWEQKVFTEWM